MSSPTPDSLSASSSPASSSTDLAKLAADAESSYSSDTSAPSSGYASPARARSRSPSVSTRAKRASLYLSPPADSGWRQQISRSPSPLGLIPIHRSFSSLIHKHEVPRKLLHVSIGFVVLYLYRRGFQPSSITPPLMSMLVPIASADLLRFYSPAFNALYIKFLGALMRESEVRGWNGVVWYLVGTITVLTAFPKDVAVLSILLLSWCDTAASTVGRAWGRYTPRVRKGKSLAGCLASFVVGAVTAGVFWGLIAPSTPTWPDDPVNARMWQGQLGVGTAKAVGGWALAGISVITGIVASCSEAVDAWGLDDNVVIPVLSAVGIWGALKLFG